jgi:release factor glutamine methyltransferase
VTATDVSGAALAVARDNAARLGLANVECVESDWWRALAGRRFDVIVSNRLTWPRAILTSRKATCASSPRSRWSRKATDLAALRAIVAGAGEFLAPRGALAVEHGYDQSDAVQTLFRDAGFSEIVVRRDLAGIARVVGGRLP